MQTLLKLRIPTRNEKDEIVADSNLIIIVDKRDQATVSIRGYDAYIGLDDLTEAATDLWLFLKR